MNVAQIKEAVRKRDGYRCTECGMTREQHQKRYGCTLEVHRIVPGSAYTMEGAVTLCCSCHGPKPKRPRGTLSKRGELALVIDVEPALKVALDGWVAANRRTLKAQLTMLFEQALTAQGLWPPAVRP